MHLEKENCGLNINSFPKWKQSTENLRTLLNKICYFRVYLKNKLRLIYLPGESNKPLKY